MACECKDTEYFVLHGHTRTTVPRSALCTRSVGDEQQVLSVQHKLTKEVKASHATGERRVRTSPLWVKRKPLDAIGFCLKLRELQGRAVFVSCSALAQLAM